MKTLREGDKGAPVKRWQHFLIGQKLDVGVADGVFGSQTKKATMEFQARHRLLADGVAGMKTLGQAMLLGFDALEEKPAPAKPLASRAGSTPRATVRHGDASWPPRPNFQPLVSTLARQKVFGKYAFVHAPVAGNPENIRISDNWEEKNIVRVPIPQLKSVLGAPASGQVRFHRLAAKQLQALWAAWEKAGLLDLVLTWEGSFVPRFVRGSRTVLSNHAFGTAFDINYAWNTLGARPALAGRHGSVRELIPLANANGFFWGGHFANRPDGMHFEIAVVK